jgi:uncharacterized protein YkwD
MTTKIARLYRPAAILVLLGLLAAGCQNMADFGYGGAPGVGVSASGETYLTSIRADHGLPPLAPDPTLEKAAVQQAGYMAGTGKMAHRTGWGRDFASRMRDNGVRGAAAENVAYGQATAADVLAGWMTSKGHRRNMLDPEFAHYGLASAEDAQGRKYWALVLGR